MQTPPAFLYSATDPGRTRVLGNRGGRRGSRMNALYAANWVEEAHTKRTGVVTSWAVNPKVHIKFQRLAAAERERGAEERKKIEQVVEVFRRSRVSQ